ncbi:MAG: DNA polymerase Y family protein [Pseudomonadota bacterium]|nr:DNA polymerase Y family protein [Pseudomonadota bacterium]
MRWLAIHLPALPLEIYTRALETETPLAVSQRRKAEQILLCNKPASERGIRPGLPVGGALALAADLRVLPRKPQAERAALERLALWCGRFTPEVSLEPPQALVLEVAHSLRLFGGAQALLEQISSGVKGLGYRACCCLALTPAGALALAACGQAGVIPGADALRAALARLPLAALGLDERELADLWRMGLRRMEDLLRLPRAGLAERLGVERIHQLERLLGEAPDPRPRFEPPARYRGRLELPMEVPESGALVFACRRLIDELAGFLLSRQGGVQRLEWRFHHEEEEDTRLTLGAARPERDPSRWLDLLRERLDRLQLPAPVRALSLDVRDLQPLPPATLQLFPELERPRTPDARLLDRLRARLGQDAVRGLALVADHRPERAWCWCSPGEVGSGGGRRRDRPLWLLLEPVPLQTRNRRPWWDGELDLGMERERIETGWWDGHEVARDYFVATTLKGERLWIFRELKGRRGWYLHGLFG